MSHIYREANNVPDFMANIAKEMMVGCHHFDLPPPDAYQLLEWDILGVD